MNSNDRFFITLILHLIEFDKKYGLKTLSISVNHAVSKV